MEYVTSRDGTRIAFERYGDGPAVVIVPGAFCDHRAFVPLAEALAPRFTAITYDRRARGASGDAAPAGGEALEREIEDLDAVIAATGGPACVVGHSSGCFLAMHAAARGSAITRLALYDPPFPEDPAAWDPMTDKVVPRLRELLGQGRKGDAVAFYQADVIGLPREMIDRFRQTPGWSDLEAIAPSLVYEGLIVTDPELPKLPAAVPVPALVIGGEAGFAPKSGRQTAEALPSGRYHPLPDQTHDVVPEVVAPVLVDYLGQAPSVVERPEQPYVGISAEVTLTTMGKINDRVPELFGWLASRGIAPAGPLFYRHRLFNPAGRIEVEAGVPVATAMDGEGDIRPGVLPAGRYASLGFTGHPDQIGEHVAELRSWAETHGLSLDVEQTAEGERMGCYMEMFKTDPQVEPDWNKWEIELAFRLADTP